MNTEKSKSDTGIFYGGNIVISRSGLIVMVSQFNGMKPGLFSAVVIQGNSKFPAGFFSMYWTMDSFSQCYGDIFNTELLRAELIRLREQNRNILRNFITTRRALKELSDAEQFNATVDELARVLNKADRLSQIGCDCIDVEIGSYKNQVMITDLPAHMKAYKEKAGGDPNSICVDACIEVEIRDLWALGITTTGCCCGHNRLEPYIGVIPEDIERMKQLGYQVQHNPSRPGDEDTFYSKTIKLIE